MGPILSMLGSLALAHLELIAALLAGGALAFVAWRKLPTARIFLFGKVAGQVAELLAHVAPLTKTTADDQIQRFLAAFSAELERKRGAPLAPAEVPAAIKAGAKRGVISGAIDLQQLHSLQSAVARGELGAAADSARALASVKVAR